MPLTVVRSHSNEALWGECRDRFLAEIGEERGPTGYASHLWIAHANQRDALFEEAMRRGLPGWLAPPISFLSELRDRFEIRERPVGHLTGRLLVARIAARQFRRAGLGSGRGFGSRRCDQPLQLSPGEERAQRHPPDRRVRRADR